MQRNKANLKKTFSYAFTIVELLIVIVIIGILAAITIVSYTGITGRATGVSLQSDLATAKKQFELYKVDHGQYPTGLDGSNCALGNIAPSPDTKYCLKPSNGAAFYLTGGGISDYSLTLIKGSMTYVVTNNSAPTSATNTSTTFVKTWGGTGDDAIFDLVQTSDGGYAITGQSASFGAGSYDALIAKYDSSGNLSWNKTWGGTGDDYARHLVQTSDGGYAIAGITTGYGAGNYDSFLAKFNSSGGLSWSKTWGGTGYDQVASLIQTSDGGYAMTGSTDSYGAVTTVTFLAKYDTSGNLSWNKTYIIDNYCGSPNDLIQTSDGGYAMTGAANKLGTGGYDGFLAKTNTSGNLSWIKTWDMSSNDGGYALVQTSDGGYAIAGIVDDIKADACLIKYDASGNLSWSKAWDGTGNDYAYDLVQTDDGGYAIAGITNGYGAGGYDGFLAKFNSSGGLSWSKTWGGTGYDYFQHLIKTSDGGYIIAGNTSSYGAGNGDIVIIKTNSLGVINNCNSTMCQSLTATITAPTATITAPGSSATSPTATVTSPSATVTSPSATSTTIVAP